MTSDSEQAEALKALQNALHNLQASGVWTAVVNLPVPPAAARGFATRGRVV